jgi:RimJ/RimL family protein N-acetyltransferase
MINKFKIIEGTKGLSKKAYGVLALLIVLAGYGAYHWISTPHLKRPEQSAQKGNYAEAYKVSLALKDGSTIILQPIKNTQDHFRQLRITHTEPSCAAMMTSGKPWTEEMTKGNQMVYAFSWELFHDLQKSGKVVTQPLTLGFLVFDEKGLLLGDMGLQTEKDRADEVFFNILPEARRKGIGYIGGRYLIEFYEKYFGKKALGANILPHNIPSQKLMIKLGFTRKKGADGKQAIVPMHGRSYELWERIP